MRLKAVRCTECGDVRWCLFSTADPTSPCELCGGEMKIERRTPGGGPRQLLRERRNAGPGVMPVSRRTPLAGYQQDTFPHVEAADYGTRR